MSESRVAGVFVTFEGCEGCGKSTQLARLAARLSDSDASVVVFREPGGTRIGELVRQALLDPDNADMDSRAELLLYEASRAQLVAEHIRPALDRGDIVVCDRFYDSTTAYQGYGRGLPLEEIHALNDIATGGLTPDITVVLDIDAAHGLTRATIAGADRLEAEELSFHQRVRDGYRRIADAEPERVALVDASGPPETVELRVLDCMRRVPRLAEALGGTA